MARNLLAVLLTIIAIAMFAPAQPATASEPIELSGVITAVGEQGISLHTRRGDVRITVTERTVISLNGERVRLGALQPRDRAHVVAERVRTRQGPRLVAHSIRAFRR